jgi:hypothetical protein
MPEEQKPIKPLYTRFPRRADMLKPKAAAPSRPPEIARPGAGRPAIPPKPAAMAAAGRQTGGFGKMQAAPPRPAMAAPAVPKAKSEFETRKHGTIDPTKSRSDVPNRSAWSQSFVWPRVSGTAAPSRTFRTHLTIGIWCRCSTSGESRSCRGRRLLKGFPTGLFRIRSVPENGDEWMNRSCRPKSAGRRHRVCNVPCDGSAASLDGRERRPTVFA